MAARLLSWLCLMAVVAAEEIPRAVQVVEPPPGAPVVPDRVVSWTEQFRVGGGDQPARGAVAVLAEEAKSELLALTGGKYEWKVPVTIRLHGRQGDPLPPKTLNLQLLSVAGVNELVLDLHLSRGLDQERERLKRGITTALLYERALVAGAAADAERPLLVPSWLTEGLREATDWRLKLSDRRVYEALFKKGGLFKLDDLFAVDDAGFEQMDGVMRVAFRVSAGALVMALLEQPQGKEGFRAFLDEAAAYEGEMPGLLRKHFPELNLSESSLAKWWSLQMANKGGLNLLTDILSIRQTEAALADALGLVFRAEDGEYRRVEVAGWAELAGVPEPERIAAVRGANDALTRLSFRCFPSYRPLLAEYQSVLAAIAKNETKDVAKRLAALEETRVIMMAKADRARDYLDWFEITRARETSGAFEDYLRLKERLKANPHRRDDELSRYLDRMNRVFDRGSSRVESRFSATTP